MDKNVIYRDIIKKIIKRYIEIINRYPDPYEETEGVYDETGNNYLIQTVGWKEGERIWHTLLYTRIRNNKFYIEVDWLERGVTTDLLEAGVPREDIVLAFHPPEMRPYTEFAVA